MKQTALVTENIGDRLYLWLGWNLHSSNYFECLLERNDVQFCLFRTCNCIWLHAPQEHQKGIAETHRAGHWARSIQGTEKPSSRSPRRKGPKPPESNDCRFFCSLCFLFFPRAFERRVFQKEGGVNRSTYKRSSHMWYLLTTSHIWHLLTSSHIWHLLTSDIFSHLLTSDIFSHLTSSHIFSHLTSSHIWHLLTSSHIWHLLTSDIFSHLLTSDIFSHLTSSHIFSHLTSSHIFSHLTSSHIWHLLTSSHIWHLLTSDIFSHLLTSDIFSHLTSSHIFSHLTSSHIFSHLTSSHISHLHISLLYSFYLRRGAGPAIHHEHRPSAEIVRVGGAKPRRNCDTRSAWSTLCGDRACRMRET